MRKIVMALFVLLAVSLAEDAFKLPDLFVTAKNGVKLDAGSRITENLKDPWLYQSFITEPLQAASREKSFLGSVPLMGQSAGAYYNAARVRLALPMLLDFGLYHAGTWGTRPYVLSLDRLGGDRRFASDTEESGKFWGAIELEDSSVIDIVNKEHSLALSRVSMWGIGWATKIQFPLALTLKTFNSNAYAGNSAASYLLADMSSDIGKINLLDTHFPTSLKAGILSSKTNTGLDLRADLLNNPTWFGVPQRSVWNVGLWSNAGAAKFVLGVKNSMDLSIDRRPVNVWLDWGVQRPDLEHFLKADYVEMPDAVFVPDEKLAVGATLEGFLRLKDTINVSWTSYANIKALNDSDSDGYYTFDSFSGLGCLRFNALFKDVRFLDESFEASVGMPIYTREIPNQFDKWADLSWKKPLFDGEVMVRGNVWMRELGSTTGLYKSQYMDLECSYDQVLSRDFSWGLQLKNLFANGQTSMAGHVYGDPTLSFQANMVF